MRSSLVLLAMLLSSGPLRSQSCQPINLATDAQKRMLLREYIASCHQRHFFPKGQGAVQCIAYQDAEGRPCWLLSALTDDRYRAAPPARYARLGHDVILVYQGDANGNALPLAGNSAGREACLSQVLGGRLHHYTKERQYALDKAAPGEPKQMEVREVTGGNAHNDLLIKFNKDGTVTKLVLV